MLVRKAYYSSDDTDIDNRIHTQAESKQMHYRKSVDHTFVSLMLAPLSFRRALHSLQPLPTVRLCFEYQINSKAYLLVVTLKSVEPCPIRSHLVAFGWAQVSPWTFQVPQ